MKIVTAFYAGLVLDEYDPGVGHTWAKKDWPDGTYFYNKHQQRWYLHHLGSSSEIPIDEVPAQLRTIVLLLS